MNRVSSAGIIEVLLASSGCNQGETNDESEFIKNLSSEILGSKALSSKIAGK